MLSYLKYIILKLAIFGLFLVSISAITSFAQTAAPAVAPTKPTTTQQTGTGGRDPGSLTYLNLTNFECFFNQEGCAEENTLYPKIIKFLKDISLPLATLFIIFGGFEWINDKDVKRTSAQATIFAAIGGYIVINLSDKIAEVIRLTIDRDNGFNPTAINDLLENLIIFGLNISTIVCVACIVLAGYSYYVEYFWNEGRQSDKLKPNDLMYGAITGLIVILLSRPIIYFVKSIFVVDKEVLTFDKNPIVQLIQSILIQFAIPVSAIAAVGFLVVAGYFYMTAQGDPKKVETAQTMIKNAIIGFVIILLCSTIVQLITFFIRPVERTLPNVDNNARVIEGNKAPALNPGENTGTPRINGGGSNNETTAPSQTPTETREPAVRRDPI